MFYSVIIPVYNRPDEIEELLKCLVNQSYTNFEVCVVESGSELRKSDFICEQYKSQLNIKYLPTGNFGPGISRNFGMKHAKGDFFIILDSDVLLEPDFISNIHSAIETQNLDCYGGPDKCHPSFLPIEKAFNYSLTSFLTTGGMRGGEKRATTFFPRSFNMGFSRKVYEATGGYPFGFMGEDLVLSLKIKSLGFKIALIPNAFVYHHRKKDFKTFFRYMKFFGKSRINILKHVPGSLKIIHLVPVGFIIFFIMSYLSVFIHPYLFIGMKTCLYGYLGTILIDSTSKNNSFYIGLLSVFATIVQNFGYGLGFLEAFWKRIVLRDQEAQKNI
jgi:glycosyltransferase involved in cell wall biosynthesis